MQRPILSALVAAAAIVATVAGSAHSAVRATGQSFSLTLDGRRLALPSTHWRPGTVHITAAAHSGEQEITLLRFRPGYDLARFLADGRAADGHDAAATEAFKRLAAGTDFLGGVDVFPGERLGFTATVRPGTYYLAELDARPLVRKIRVSGAAAAAEGPAAATIEEYDFGFRIVHGPLPAHGTVTVRNVGKLPHRLNFEPLRPGTTRAEVGAFLRRTGGGPNVPPPPFALHGPEFGTSVLSPGESIQFTYAVPHGTYALVSWQEDTPDGKPQALRGMYTVTVLR